MAHNIQVKNSLNLQGSINSSTGQKLLTIVQTTREQLKPRVPDRTEVIRRDKCQKQRQEKTFNTRRELSKPSPGNTVWVPDRDLEAIVGHETNPQSYEVETDEGTYQRNCKDTIRLQDICLQETNLPNPEQTSASDTQYRSSNWTVQPPKRYDKDIETFEGRCSVRSYSACMYTIYCL